MIILKLPSYTFPEMESSTHLSEDLEQAMIEAGHKLVLYAPTPTRGTSKEFRRRYKHCKYEERYNGKIEIHRFPMFREYHNVVLRAFRYILVNICQYFHACRISETNVVYSGSTPPTQGLLCAMVAKKLSKKLKHHVGFVYAIQDMFPESMVAAGLCKKGSILEKIGAKVSDYAYKNADQIIAISNQIQDSLINKGVSQDKIAVVYNWIDVNQIHHVSRTKNPLFQELGLNKNKFYVTYAGNLGYAQSIDTILQAAKLLDSYEEIEFIIFGTGVLFEKVKTEIKKQNNVKLFPTLPLSRISQVYSLGNASIVSCKKGVGAGSLPSKTMSIMATGTPLLVSFDSGTELQKIILETNSGLFSEAENFEMLANNILKLYENKNMAIQMGDNARHTAETLFGKQQAVNKYIQMLEKAGD